MVCQRCGVVNTLNYGVAMGPCRVWPYFPGCIFLIWIIIMFFFFYQNPELLCVNSCCVSQLYNTWPLNLALTVVYLLKQVNALSGQPPFADP